MEQERKRSRPVSRRTEGSSVKSSTSASDREPPRKVSKLNRDDGGASLCQRCSGINFGEIFSTRINRSLGEFVVNLEESVDELKASQCALCEVIATMLLATHDETNVGSDKQRHLRAFSANRAFAGPGWRGFLGQDSTVLGVIPISQALAKSGKNGALSRVTSSLSKTGYLGAIQNSVPTETFGFRRLCSDRFDENFAKDCISYCTKNHGQACNDVYGQKLPKLFFRVIDCSSRRIIKAVSKHRYVALSYLWGLEPFSQPDFQHRNHEPGLPDDCPRVVNDSIAVALKLGYKYLWVDRYCIDQEDSNDKAMQISQMDRIYSNAYITIVASAGDGPDYGLPGVNKKPRRPQPSLRVGGLSLVSSLPDPKLTISSSKWATRGWTFQEGFLSKRRLFFNEEQVSFECNTMGCAEVLWQPTDALHCRSPRENGKRELRVGIPSTSFHSKAPGSVPLDIMIHLSNFTRRELTYSSDALNAFQGVFHAFACSAKPVYQLVGIPIFPSTHIRKTNAKFPYLRSSAAGFVMGLSWYHKVPGKRRILFPSWSWAGWEGQIEPTLLWAAYWEVELLNIWIDWIEEQDGNRIKFPDGFGVAEGTSKLKDLKLPDTVKFIGLRGGTCPCKMVYIDVDEDSNEQDRGSHRSPAVSGYYIEMPLSSGNSCVYAPAYLDGPTKELLKGKLLCMMLQGGPGSFEEAQAEQWFLLVRGGAKRLNNGNMGELWERVGFAAFHEGFVKIDGEWVGGAKWSVDVEEVQGWARETLRLG